MSIGQILQERPFREIMEEFSEYRIDPFIQSLRAKKGANKGDILPFVRGLRLSARLIYVIRDILSNTDFEINWGHILINQETLCSKECDIIIHEKGFKSKWNGNDNPVMNFKFIKIDKVKAVISCKSYVQPYGSPANLDKEFYNSISNYIDNVYVFAECCDENKKDNVIAKAKQIGYKDFWCIYTLDDEQTPKRQPIIWNNFIKEMEKIK